MNLPLLRLNFQRHWVSCLACWMFPVVMGIGMGIVYPLLRDNYKLIQTIMEAMKSVIPKGFQQVDVFTPQGAYAWPFLHPLTLMANVVVMAIPATAMPAGERGDGGLHLLLAAPVSRVQLIMTQITALVILALVFAISPCVGALAGALITNDVANIPWGTYFLVALNFCALGVFHGAVGLLVSVGALNRGVATIRYGIVMAAFFLISLLGDMLPPGDFPKGTWLLRFTPLGYYNPYSILEDSTQFWTGSLALLVPAMLMFFVAARLFRRRPLV